MYPGLQKKKQALSSANLDKGPKSILGPIFETQELIRTCLPLRLYRTKNKVCIYPKKPKNKSLYTEKENKRKVR